MTVIDFLIIKTKNKKKNRFSVRSGLWAYDSNEICKLNRKTFYYYKNYK